MADDIRIGDLTINVDDPTSPAAPEPDEVAAKEAAQTAIAQVFLTPPTTCVPGADIPFEGDTLVWHGKIAIGEIVKITGSPDGTALLYTVRLFDACGTLTDASLDGLSIDGPDRPTGG